MHHFPSAFIVLLSQSSFFSRIPYEETSNGSSRNVDIIEAVNGFVMIRRVTDGPHHLLGFHDLSQVIPGARNPQDVAALAGVRALHPLTALSRDRRIEPLGLNLLRLGLACSNHLVRSNRQLEGKYSGGEVLQLTFDASPQRLHFDFLPSILPNSQSKIELIGKPASRSS